MWIDRNHRNSAFPSLVIATLGLLCVWASRCWADDSSTTWAALQLREAKADTFVEGICDNERTFLKTRFDLALQERKLCADESPVSENEKASCIPNELTVHQHTYSLKTMQRPLAFKDPDRVEFVENKTHKTISDRAQILQLLVESRLTYLCSWAHTHLNPDELYGATAPSGSPHRIDPAAISRNRFVHETLDTMTGEKLLNEIAAARRKMDGGMGETSMNDPHKPNRRKQKALMNSEAAGQSGQAPSTPAASAQ